MDVPSKLDHGPGARRARAWTSSRPASRSPRRPTRRPRARLRGEVRRPVIAALARCPPAGHRGGRPRRSSRPNARASTRSWRPPTCTSRQAAHDARGSASRRPSTRVKPRPPASPTTWSSRRRTRRAATATSCAASSKPVIDAGATTVNLPDTVGYAMPDEIREFFDEIIAPRAQRRQGRLQHPLPRRPRAGRRQQPRGASRAASGRSSAPSTASASAPATRRSRNS